MSLLHLAERRYAHGRLLSSVSYRGSERDMTTDREMFVVSAGTSLLGPCVIDYLDKRHDAPRFMLQPCYEAHRSTPLSR
jgi:hypothetical protein